MLRLATSQRTPLRARLAAAAVGLANTATAPLTTAGSDKGCLDSCRRWLGSAAAAATDAARLPPLEPWPHAGEPISRAATPPSSWYAQPGVLEREESAVFQRSWLAVAHANRVAAPGAYTAGSLLSLEWLACRDEQGGLHAFHNVRSRCLGGGWGVGCMHATLLGLLATSTLLPPSLLHEPAAVKTLRCLCPPLYDPRRCAATTPPFWLRGQAQRAASSARTMAGRMGWTAVCSGRLD